MSQTRTWSAIEAVASTAIGLLVSWAITPPVLALFGYSAGAGTAFGISCIYTAISLARGYVVRRLFNRLDRRRWERAKSRRARDVSGELLPGRRATNDNTRAQWTRKGAA